MYKIILINNKLNVSSFVIPDASIFEIMKAGLFNLKGWPIDFAAYFKIKHFDSNYFAMLQCRRKKLLPERQGKSCKNIYRRTIFFLIVSFTKRRSLSSLSQSKVTGVAAFMLSQLEK